MDPICFLIEKTKYIWQNDAANYSLIITGLDKLGPRTLGPIGSTIGSKGLKNWVQDWVQGPKMLGPRFGSTIWGFQVAPTSRKFKVDMDKRYPYRFGSTIWVHDMNHRFWNQLDIQNGLQTKNRFWILYVLKYGSGMVLASVFGTFWEPKWKFFDPGSGVSWKVQLFRIDGFT